MPESPLLPWELLDSFIDELGSNIFETSSRDALRNCALTCHRFHLRADNYLFNEVIVKASPRTTFVKRPDQAIGIGERLQNFLSVLTANDTLAPRVRSFTVDSSIESHETLYENIHLLEIICKLSSLYHFGWTNIGVPFKWSLLSNDIRAAFDNLFVSPSLRSLSFEGVTHMRRLSVVRCDQLEHLRLVNVSDTIFPRPPPPPYPNMRVKSLVNFNSLDMYNAIIHEEAIERPCLSFLRDLHVWMNNENQVRRSRTAMKAASKTLELLDIPELSHFRYPRLIPGPINIGILTNLRTIKMGCRLTTLDGVIFPRGICGLLGAPSEPMLVENIHIQLDWIDCRVGSEQARFVDEPTWGELDEILSDVFKYPVLKVVYMTLKLGYGWCLTEGNQPPSGVVQLKDKVQRLASGLLPKTQKARNTEVSIQLLLYKSLYAIEEIFA
ncbi:hypothetical protein BDN70DRAFT_884594 [Pholiota conissans]|uniref:Uncharacterized protein n=1 Tax=Pholiota conissans TaxID=109636 RepID=A0A9P5YRM2_9AGAR|nr:hypothetical protein BDN70DRAFT_884594 [Pholiota conissans]